MAEYFLYLDDERPLPDPKSLFGDMEMVAAKSFKDFKETILARGAPFMISFDWYLGVGCADGLDAAKWLIEHDKTNDILGRDFLFDAHSSNVDKAREIMRLLAIYLEGKHDCSEMMNPGRRIRKVKRERNAVG
jgi:hypothetical protein